MSEDSDPAVEYAIHESSSVMSQLVSQHVDVYPHPKSSLSKTFESKKDVVHTIQTYGEMLHSNVSVESYSILYR
jgi:hypothetical protein